MNSKTVEHNSNRLLIVITYQDEQFLAGIFILSGVAILMFTYLGIAPKILASFIQASDLFIFCYIAGFLVFMYGLFGLYRSSLVSKFAFDKIVNKLEVECKYFTKTTKQVLPLSEVTGIEQISRGNATPELFLWIKKGNQVRGEKMAFAKASATSLHMLWREVSEFLKDQTNLMLSGQWLIEQNEDMFKIYTSRDTFSNPDRDRRVYTVDRKAGYLIYELDGEEVGRYKTQDIKNVETEINPDKSDEEISDHIVLTMIDDGKIPISSYWYYTGSHAVVVRALKYALGLEKYLHISPNFYIS